MPDRYKITFEAYDKLASRYQDKFMDLDLYNDTYDRFCELIKNSTPEILEIACGPGNITRYILSKIPQAHLLGTDVAPNMIKLAETNNPTAEFKVMDCRQIDKLDQKFDAIICGFCMPYLSKQDCKKLIGDCSTLLNNGGVFYFSTIEGCYANSGYESDSSGKINMYVYQHEEEYLLNFLNHNGFSIKELVRKQYSKPKGTETHLIVIASKE